MEKKVANDMCDDDHHPYDLQTVIQKRIELFESIKAEKLAHLKSISGEPIKVCFDGKVKEGKAWETTPFDIAKEFEKSQLALISKVNDKLWDMSRPLEGDCEIKFYTFDSDEGRDTFWHSSAHILGQALEKTYGCKLCIGPCSIKGEGFYYDAFYGDFGLNEGHFEEIVKGAKKAVAEKQPFERIEVSRKQALDIFSDNKFKDYKLQLEKAKKNDHRELGRKQELFFMHPCSLGSTFLLPHGTRVYNKLKTFIRNQYWERGYEEVETPDMCKMELWETSGHAAKYKENMFLLDIDKNEFGLKPMNCPGHCLIFNSKPRSYRELPLRLADFGVLHRNEASGALRGMTRLRTFHQDDAHIFCRESQIKEEVKRALDFVDYAYSIFGFSYELKLSTRPEKYVGDLETWKRAEDALEEALNELKKPWEMNEGDGAFYGPKIDICVCDAMKRKFQLTTLQLDFNNPRRFNLSYATEDDGSDRRETPVIIHRAILGSLERMFAILLEHYEGKWPFWLSPRQAIVCPVSLKWQAYAEKVKDAIHKAGYYVDIDTSDHKLQKKVREAQLAQYNYILVVGEDEANTGKVSVRLRDEEKHSDGDKKKEHLKYSIAHLLAHFKEEVEAFHLKSRLPKREGFTWIESAWRWVQALWIR